MALKAWYYQPCWHHAGPGLPHTLTTGDTGAAVVVMLAASSTAYAYQLCRAFIPKLRKAD